MLSYSAELTICLSDVDVVVVSAAAAVVVVVVPKIIRFVQGI